MEAFKPKGGQSMTDAQQREAARQFYYKWNGKGREDEDARSYWIEILQNILGVDHVTDRVDFEKKVIGPDGNTKRIDVYIPETHVLIEQKSLGIALDKPQAGHGGMTPYQQAKMYDNGLIVSEKARWIVTSNFAEIWIYDMEQSRPEPVKLMLEDLQSKYHVLDFLVNQAKDAVNLEMELSLRAGELVGRIYDAFLKQYKNPDDPETLKSLNKLCVRIVFCLYAEDAAVFGKKGMFHDYMAQFDAKGARKALRDLFRVLDQRAEDRDPYLADDDPLLAAFPYVNGGLFSAEDIEIPPFTEEILDLILRKASDDFDWSGISPTIFGAVFESTLNPETRRSGGMHYTSLENIHKVIDPLFLDELKAEFEACKAVSVAKTREKKLLALQEKIASLSFLDPSAGSGNFLTESYLCLRRLENAILRELLHDQIAMGDETITPIKVSISQFYGIEINDFAVTVARTALWIAENQMMQETEDILHSDLEFLPLKTNAYIVEGNALRIDWNDVVPKEKLNYIMGNPPFVGYAYQTKEQKSDLAEVCSECGKNIDYVAGWYYKTAGMMNGTGIRAALVSTNSITQGEQVSSVWKNLIENLNVHIDFAYRTFRWDSEASDKAHVHCVIIGFSCRDLHPKFIFEDDVKIQAENINPYLLNAPTVFVERRTNPLYDVPPFVRGCQPTDDGNFILTEAERNELLQHEPQAETFIRPFMMGKDFIQRKPRYCIWLKGANPAQLKKCPQILARVENVRAFRQKSTKAATRAKAETPTLFDEIREPNSNYIGFPTVSSERRKYVPIDYLTRDIIPGNKIYFMQDATLYHFGVITSNVHMAWTRAICGRLKSDYNYSNTIVYNNFPWPEVTDAQKAEIEKTAQAILDARALYPDSSLADLYDELTMPPELRKAHQANDRAVMKAYGMSVRDTDEAACVAHLMRLYQEKTAAR